MKLLKITLYIILGLFLSCETAYGQNVMHLSTTAQPDVSATFWRMARDSLMVQTTAIYRHPFTLAPADKECTYSGRSQRMYRIDSVQVSISNAHRVLYSNTLQHDDVFFPNTPYEVNDDWTFTLLDITMADDPCSVNEGQIWFHWELAPPGPRS